MNILVKLETLLTAGVRLSHRPSQLSEDATLHYDVVRDVFHVYDPRGVGSTEHDSLAEAWALFQQMVEGTQL